MCKHLRINSYILEEYEPTLLLHIMWNNVAKWNKKKVTIAILSLGFFFLSQRIVATHKKTYIITYTLDNFEL